MQDDKSDKFVYINLVLETHKSSSVIRHISNYAKSRERALYSLTIGHLNSASKGCLQMLARGYQTPTPTIPKQNTKKSTGRDVGSSRKRPRKEMPAPSSGSTLTNISSTNKGLKPVIDYPKPAKIHENFLVHCQDCYQFGMDKIFVVNIEQMIVAQDAIYKHNIVVV